MNKKEAKRILHSNFFPKNRRGQGLSTSAIVLIILGIAVLVLLILGFTMGWDKIFPWLGGNNVDSVVQQCSVACASGSDYGFCSQERTLKAEDIDGGKMTTTCGELANNPTYSKYGIEECSTIDCDMALYEWVSNEPVCVNNGGEVVATEQQASKCEGVQPTGTICCEYDY